MILLQRRSDELTRMNIFTQEPKGTETRGTARLRYLDKNPLSLSPLSQAPLLIDAAEPRANGNAIMLISQLSSRGTSP